MIGKILLSRLGNFLVGEAPVRRFRLFELAFTAAFLILISRNLLEAREWLTSRGYHRSVPGLSGIEPLPLLPGWAIPFFVVFVFGAGFGVAKWAKGRRFCFGLLFFAAVYAQGVDTASAFALNKIYIAGFLFLAFSPGRDNDTASGSIAGVRAFQGMLLTLYFATGIAKARGDWLSHSDVVWTHAQGIYRTETAAWLLRNLPLWGWAAIQHSVLVFELGAPLWFGWRRTRPVAIAFGLGFHLGIALLMKAVWVFSLQMAAFYVLFLPDDWAGEVLRRLQNATRALLGDRAAGQKSRCDSRPNYLDRSQ
ncbi:MAG: HTTM domain-containing protein [Verrucomicrobiae bacterium]|nr:HTTM domain-containing protein [Verrucomicrobiae bacterium]MCP5539149.1 HTTM domain-containing protein [Akkermansiaceae bacterium]MCP5549800.1 HTTM domain-containing protein [Akkermansiaceae bacterium]